MFVYKRANLSRRIRFDKTKQNDKEKSALKRIQEMLKKHEKKIVTALIAAWLLSGDDIDEQDISTSMTSDAEPDDIADDIADSTSETYERHIQDFAYSSLEAEAEEVGREQFDAMSEDYRDVLHEPENLSPPRIPETEPDMSFDDSELPPAPEIDLEPNQFSYEAFYDSWCSERAGALIRDFTDGQRDNVKTLVREALANGDSPKMLKRRLRDTVGLTQRQTEVNARYYRSVYNGLKEANPKMSDEAAAERASAAAQKMAEKQLSARAKAIARSELNAAHNEASRAYVRWCIERGLLKNVYSQWVTSGNDNVCPMCFALNGQTIPFGEEYSIPAGIPYHSGTTKGPPGHPNCCCGEIFVENGQASDGNAKIWENMSDTEKKKHINYHSDKKTYEEYKKRLGKENVPETLDKFQEMKYNSDRTEYENLEYYYRNINGRPIEYVKIDRDIEQAGITGRGKAYPVETIEVKGWRPHAEHRLKQSNLTKEDATGYMDNAVAMMKRYPAPQTQLNYYSEMGIIGIRSEDGIVQTVISQDRFDEKTYKILEVMKKWLQST